MTECTKAVRIHLNDDPFARTSAWPKPGVWPAKWVWHPDTGRSQRTVVAFRLRFQVSPDDAQSPLRVHVSADERYRLFLDGVPVGRGPERGCPEQWYYESYQLDLPPGDHRLAAQVWWLGDGSPWAQMTLRGGFLLAAEGAWCERLSTGVAPWQVSPPGR